MEEARTTLNVVRTDFATFNFIVLVSEELIWFLYSSSMVATLPRSLTSPGTLMNHGSFALLVKTTLCRLVQTYAEKFRQVKFLLLTHIYDYLHLCNALMSVALRSICTVMLKHSVGKNVQKDREF